jgi:hypothetical protein
MVTILSGHDAYYEQGYAARHNRDQSCFQPDNRFVLVPTNNVDDDQGGECHTYRRV